MSLERTHRVSARVHARKRFYERYGLWISNGVYRDACDEIARGENAPIAMARGGGTIHLVRILAYVAPAVWNPQLQCIVTFLERNPIELRYPKIAQASA